MPVEINQIPITTTSLTSGSFFPVDLATGGSPAYETRKATLNTIANEVLDEQLTGDRFLNINGNVLNLYGGQVSIGTPLESNYALEVNNSDFAGGGIFSAPGVAVRGVSSTGYGGVFEGISGIEVYSTSGEAVFGISVSGGLGGHFEGVSGMAAYSTSGTAVLGLSQGGGLGGKFEGGAYVETYGLAGSPEASAVFEASATTKGALMPRMTTTQRDAISSPATGLEIFNITTNRKEHYNGTYWAGHPTLYSVQALTSSPVDAQTVYFGNLPKAPTTTADTSKVHIEHNGVIRKVNIYCYSGTAGTAQNWSLYIRINGTTDYLIETIGAATNERIFNNESLNIPVVDGDYFEIKAVNPTWGTNPLTTVFGGNIVLE